MIILLICVHVDVENVENIVLKILHQNKLKNLLKK